MRQRRAVDTKLGRTLFPVVVVMLSVWGLGVKLIGWDTWWAWLALAVAVLLAGLMRLALRRERRISGLGDRI